MSQQQTPRRVSLRQGNLLALRDPRIIQSCRQAAPTPTNLTAAEAALSISSLSTPSQVHHPCAQAKSAHSVLTGGKTHLMTPRF